MADTEQDALQPEEVDPYQQSLEQADQETPEQKEAILDDMFPPAPEEDLKDPHELQGEAEAILQISTNADEGVYDLIESFKSSKWTDPEVAGNVVETYANLLRDKFPGSANKMGEEEVLEASGVKPADVGYDVNEWEKQNLAAFSAENAGENPWIRAYGETLYRGIEDVATQRIKETNQPWQITDKSSRFVLGFVPEAARSLGVEKYMERLTRADSDDTYASAFAGAAGSIAPALLGPVGLAIAANNITGEGIEQYRESKRLGADEVTALEAGAFETANQAMDYVLDKLIVGKATRGVGSVVGKAVGEGSQEFVQDKISDVIDVFGLTKEEYNDFFDPQAIKSGIVGTVVGGVVAGGQQGYEGLTSQEGLSDQFGQSLASDFGQPPAKVPVGKRVQPAPAVRDPFEDDLGLSQSYPETLPRKTVAVVGEPVAGGTNITTVESAGTGAIEETAREPAITTDKDEAIFQNEDGTTQRVVQGEKKQAHSNAMVVSPDTAVKLGNLQQVEGVTVQTDDLGRDYVDNRFVAQDLSVTEEPVNPDPVMVPPSEDGTGHVLQTSERLNEYNSLEKHASLSQGVTTGGVSTAGAQQVKESSAADKLRNNPNLHPLVREALALDDKDEVGPLFSNLLYAPQTNSDTADRVDEIFAKYDNDYMSFANTILAKPFAEITSDEALAARVAANAINGQLAGIEAKSPKLAATYAQIATQLYTASVAVRTDIAQQLQSGNIVPLDGSTVNLALRAELNQLATAKAAQEEGTTPAALEQMQAQEQRLDEIETGMNARSDEIAAETVEAQERHDAPERAVEGLEKEIKAIDETQSPEVAEAQKHVEEVTAKFDEVEKEAQALEKQADDLENAEQAVDDWDNKIEVLEKTPTEPSNAPIEALKAKKTALTNPNENPQVKALQEKSKAAKKGSPEKTAAQLAATQALEKAKTEGAAERAKIDQQLLEAQKAYDEEKARLKAEKEAKLKEARHQRDVERAEAARLRKEAIAAKRKAAQELRTKRAAEKAAAEKARDAAKKQQDIDRAARKAQKKLELQAARDLRDDTRKARKAQLAADLEALKAKKDQVDGDKKKIQEKRDRNKRIRDLVEKYRREFQQKLSPAEAQRIQELTDFAKKANGDAQHNALQELGRTLCRIKGIELLPGANPWEVLWQSNTLSGLGTQVSNIAGNLVNPVAQVLRDVGSGNPKKASRFIRGWTRALLSKRSLKDIVGGFRGEFAPRIVDLETDQDLRDLSTGVLIPVERDAVKILESKFGTGKLAKLATYPPYVLRMLSAMDAIFSRAAQQGYTAREAPSYEQYLKAKADNYNTYRQQALNEEATLKRLKVPVPKEFVTRRADQLSFLALPEATQQTIRKASRKAVYQAEEGPTGAVGKVAKGIFGGLGNVRLWDRKTYLNTEPRSRIADALSNTLPTVRDGVSIEEIYPLVLHGVGQGQSVEINGKAVSGSTKALLGELSEALNNKQVINLRGKGARPLKYIVGMFVNTSSQVLDLSMECLPYGIGIADKVASGSFKNMTDDERTQLYGLQIASSALTTGLLAKLLAGMDDEENQTFYVYGGMRDKALREYYKAKGIKPFTFRIGKYNFYYKDIPGINLVLGGIGELSDGHMVAKRTPDRPLTGIGTSMLTAASGAAYVATQQSMLKNLSLLTDLFAVEGTQSLQQAADVASNLTSGFLPFSSAGRDLERFVYGDLNRPKDVLGRMIQNIPYTKFFSDNKPALNMWGEPLRSHVVPGLSRLIGTSGASFEADWLLRNGYKISLPKPNANLTDKQAERYSELLKSDDPENFESVLREEDQYLYMQMVGPEMKAIVAQMAAQNQQGYNEKVQERLTNRINEAKKRAKKAITG